MTPARRHADIGNGAHLPDAAGLGDSGHERKRGWGRWVRTTTVNHNMAALDQMVTGVAGGDQETRRRSPVSNTATIEEANGATEGSTRTASSP